jgi:YebC/PmpR family DNA-binding regulatory protein
MISLVNPSDMGAQWKHAGRVANAAKKGAIFGKLVKEIIVSAKVGGGSPESNFRLRTAVEAAKKQSVPRDTIERAIKKGAGQDADANFESVTYEGFGPHQVPVIVECLTDNKNRTAADVRGLFRKGQLGGAGSVQWMFDRLGVIEATTPAKGVDLETVAIEAGAQNVEAMTAEADEVPAGATGGRFFTSPNDLDTVSKFLTANGWSVSFSELGWIAKAKADLPEAQKKEVADFLSEIEDCSDVHRIYTSL